MTLKDKKIIFLISTIIVLTLSWIVAAEISANTQVKIVSPSSGSNFTNLSLGQTFLNVTFVNASGVTGISAADFNVTFLMNNTGNGTSLWFPIATLTRGCVRISGNNLACAANSTNVSIVIPDGTYTLNANITNATQSSIIANLTNSSRSLIIDRTSPISTTSNFSAPFSAGANLSSANGGLFIINLSIADATIGVQTVLVNITNRSSGVSNATLTLTREGSTNNFVTTINTTHYLDGSYNITIIANDSLNNVNNSAVLQNIIFDSTAPEVSLSCSPNPVTRGETITCSCSVSDVTAGINSSYGTNGISTTVHPSTSQTGPSFSVGCTSQDLAGNSRSVTTTYSVVESGSSSNGGGASLSPPASSDEGKKQESSNEPDTTVQSSDQGAGTENGSSSKGISTTSKLLLTIIIAAAIVIVGAYIIRRRK